VLRKNCERGACQGEDTTRAILLGQVLAEWLGRPGQHARAAHTLLVVQAAGVKLNR
jgi:hypothetical protein